MCTRGLEIVRFNRRYYIRHHRCDSYFEDLGKKIVASIPVDDGLYKGTLRGEVYALANTKYQQNGWNPCKSNMLRRKLPSKEIRDGSEPDYSEFREFYVLPSELPRLGHDFGYVYTIDLDREVLSINHSIHWKLTNIPRQVDPWLRAIADCIYPNNFTISPNLCPEEYLVSLDLELPERNGNIAYDFRVVYPKANIGDVRKAFLTYVLANTIIGYKEEIIRYGREWGPASFPFRELVFALVSIASDQAKFRSFPAQHCDPRACSLWR